MQPSQRFPNESTPLERSSNSNFAFVMQSSDNLEAITKSATVNMANETIDKIASQFPTEKEQIGAYEKAQEGLVAPQELRNIIGESLSPFLDQLGAVNKMIKHGKYE